MATHVISGAISLTLVTTLLAAVFLSPVLGALALRGLYRASTRLARFPSRKVWSQAVASLGFLDAGDRVMAGRLRGHDVRIEELWLGVVKRGTRLSVDCDGTLPPDLELARRSRLPGPAWGTDLGDPSLGRAAFVSGPDAVVLAALGCSARRSVLEACAAGALRVHRSTVSLECSGSADRLPALARTIVCAVEGLLAARTPAQSLAAHLESEPLEAVRLRCLETLIREYPDRPDCARACEATLGDSCPEIRLRAAAVVGGERGFAVLEALVVDPALPVGLRASALDALPRAGPPAPREALVARQLRSSDAPVRAAAARAVGRLRLLGLLEPLRALAAVEDPACQEAAASSLGALGDAGAEPTLLALLAGSRRAARIAAATALGLVGTRAAVAPLKAVAEGGGARPRAVRALGGDALAATAREALRRVQSRLGDASAGQLSLAPDALTAGALSLPLPAEGALSVREAERS